MGTSPAVACTAGWAPAASLVAPAGGPSLCKHQPHRTHSCGSKPARGCQPDAAVLAQQAASAAPRTFIQPLLPPAHTPSIQSLRE